MKGRRLCALVMALLVAAGVLCFARADVTVYYDLNGGYGDGGSVVVTPQDNGSIHFYHPSDAPTRPGYRFLGWLCNNDPTYYPLDPAGKSETFAPMEGALSFTAQWMPDNHPAYAPYTVATTLYPDGGTYDALEGQWKCVQKNEATYFALHNWYSASGAYSGIADGSGYAGFQYKDGKTLVILSIWGTANGTPTIEYARPGADAGTFGGEGDGMHVLTEYPWQEWTWYTMRIQARTEGQKTMYEQWVKPEDGGWELIAVISFPRPNLGFTWDCFFQEDWAGNNLPRSCQLRGYYARNAASQRWSSLTGYDISNHMADTGAANVRYDCDFRTLGDSAVWIQTGGDGYDAKAPSIPATLRIRQGDAPSDAGLLR